MESRYKELVVEQRQRAARLEFLLLLICRLLLLVIIVVWLECVLARVLAFAALTLTHVFEG